MKSELTATDWKPVQREEGSIYLTCGDPHKKYHCAFDIATEDLELAARICKALNFWNSFK